MIIFFDKKIISAIISLMLFFSAFSSTMAFDIPVKPNHDKLNSDSFTDLMLSPEQTHQSQNLHRYIIFGHGIIDENSINTISSIQNNNGFFSIAVLSEQSISSLTARGYYVIKDFPVELHESQKIFSEMDQIRDFSGSELVKIKYNYTGNGVNIAIVDTGVDFSNPDLADSLARDQNNYPIMLDADGQGLILTNTTFVAHIDKNGFLQNTTKPIIAQINKSLDKNTTSNVYLTKNGVFLNLNQNGKGTPVSIYNSFYPSTGTSPIFNGTILDDYKIGKNKSDYIRSASGVYHFGIIYQGAIQGPFTSVQAVPVLVVDSQIPGIYDTIIPDLSTSWQDYTKFDLKIGQKPEYDYDFTDETPIMLGSGKEHLVYDSNKDGKMDYSAGTVGAQIVDVYGVISQSKSKIDKLFKATNGTALPALDSQGNFFGIMNDFVGHGTGAAASISSKGKEQYDIYNNTKKFRLPGIAPNAKIIPIKALWYGDTVYAWLWASGFDNTNNTWKFSGKPRADIISNSWGVSNFPSLKTAPGIDMLSLIVNVLSTPQSLDPKYPGVVMISSAGNAGPGYGTMGLPNAAPFGITVGATTNNVYVGYGSFKGQPRFGNTTEQANNMVDFSSRGPSIIGDPKPDLVDTGAYGFVPGNILKANKDAKVESFSIFGGTSMAAPLVSGSAAIVIEGLKEKNKDYDPFIIKNILMSTATDIQNDPFTQGSGFVNSYRAAQFLNGQGNVFIVYNNSTYSEISQILNSPMTRLNQIIPDFDDFMLSEKQFPQTSWFGGRLEAGHTSNTTFTIENPGDKALTIHVIPQKLELIEKTQTESSTKLRLKDSLYNKTDVFRPDYIKLSDVSKHDSLASFYTNQSDVIPKDAELLILNLNFAFSDFLNKTENLYASDTKIASLYLYDWSDKNKDDLVSSDELSLVNRGGSWGTVQELRVSDPNSKFEKIPLVGVYPVPNRYSYWTGELKKNSTEMNYTLSASYYKKQDWTDVWIDDSIIKVPPHSTAQINAKIIPSENAKPGLYQGFLRFIGDDHIVNAPVSFAIVSAIKKDQLIVIPGDKNINTIFGNGYVKGAFDMSNRYNAGDWRQYYFDIDDSTIDTASFDVSWKNAETNFSAFIVDPQGRIIQSNVPSGVFGDFLDYPSSDWLGSTPFSEGGGFYPVKNKDQTSTLLNAAINQTGTYTLLLHSTLFAGANSTEPFTVAAKFSSISPDVSSPAISFAINEYTNIIPEPTITDDGKFTVKYFVDDIETTISEISEGRHTIKIQATDELGNTSVKSYSFVLDKTMPKIVISNPQEKIQGTGILKIDFTVEEANPNTISVFLPDGTVIDNQTSIDFDTSTLSNGKYEILIQSTDKSENKAEKSISFEKSALANQLMPNIGIAFDYTLALLIISAILAIGISIFIILINKSRKSSKKMKQGL